MFSLNSIVLPSSQQTAVIFRELKAIWISGHRVLMILPSRDPHLPHLIQTLVFSCLTVVWTRSFAVIWILGPGSEGICPISLISKL